MKSNGFSLLELMLGLTLITLLLAFPMSWLFSFYNQHRYAALREQLLQAIEFAQQESYATHMPIGLCKSYKLGNCGAGAASHLLIFIDEYHDGVVHAKDQLLAFIAFGDSGQLHWRAFPAYRNYILFSARGLLQSDNATFWFCKHEIAQPEWGVALSKQGRARLLSKNQQGEILDSEGEPLKCG